MGRRVDARTAAAAQVSELRRAIDRHKWAASLGRGGPSREDQDVLAMLERELARWQGILDELTASVMRVHQEILADEDA